VPKQRPDPTKAGSRSAKRDTVRAVVAVVKHLSLSCSSRRAQLTLGMEDPCLGGSRQRGYRDDFRKTCSSANRVHVPRTPRFSARRRISSIDPFGNTLSKSGPLADANTYRFSSQEYHQSSGLSLYLYRANDPNLQRWLNRDPIGERGGLNLYAYVANNPISRIDFLGLTSCDELRRQLIYLLKRLRNDASALSQMYQVHYHQLWNQFAATQATGIAAGVVGGGIGSAVGKGISFAATVEFNSGAIAGSEAGAEIGAMVGSVAGDVGGHLGGDAAAETGNESAAAKTEHAIADTELAYQETLKKTNAKKQEYKANCCAK